VASGALVLFGTPLPVTGSENVTKYLTADMEKITGGRWAFEPDPAKAAKIIVKHIDKKRNGLKLKAAMYKPK